MYLSKPALCALLIAILTSANLSADWPQWRGPSRDAKSSETNLLESWEDQKPKLLWTVDGMGKGYAGVTIADGRLYTTGNFPDGQSVVAADAATGKVLWTSSLTPKAPKHGYDGSRCSPATPRARSGSAASSTRWCSRTIRRSAG